MERDMAGEKSFISDFQQTMKVQFTRCLEPTKTCKGETINAHSVQNSGAFELIAEDGHVSGISIGVKSGDLSHGFRKLSRNKASTFTGFCGKHDAEIFLPIDSRPLDESDDEQMFLVAYRSIAKEMHSITRGAMQLQMAYQNLVKQGKASAHFPDQPGMIATEYMMRAYGVYRLKHVFFDVPLLRRRFRDVLHSSFRISNRKPVLAASSVFSVGDVKPGETFPVVIVNVAPVSDSETLVIVSYPRSQSGPVRRYVSPIFLKSGDERLYELSYLLINRAENFFVRQSHVEAWGEEKRKAIENAFVGTVHSGGQDAPRLPLLNMF